MSVHDLPERPNLDQLKRQAKELLKAWRRTPGEAPAHAKLRHAQRLVAERYGFTSWDALRAKVEDVPAASPAKHRGMLYDDPVPDVIPLNGVLTRDTIRDLVERGVSGVRVSASIAADALPLLAGVPTLRRLDLSSRNDLEDRDLAFFEAMPWLTALSLAGCGRIGDGASAHVLKLVALEQINLRWTQAGDEFVAALADKPALGRVLVGGQMTDRGAARLRDFPALAQPGSGDTMLGISAASTLTDAALMSIGGLAGVVALDVHTSAFGSPHYTARGVSHLQNMTSLRELNFHGALATDAVLAEIAQVPLRSLHCQDIVSGDQGFVALGACSTLERLAARVCRRITDVGFAALARLPRLASLSLGGPRLTDDALAPLVDASELVDLGPILFGDGAFPYIGRMPRLERLTNMYNRATTDAATRHLRDHPRLRHYSAFGTQITDESLRVLSGLPRLESLEFENCSGITDEGLRELARLPRLKRVSVWSCVNVKGAWTAAVPHGVEVKSEAAPLEQSDGYRAETLMDYPDMPMPDGARGPLGEAPPASFLPTFVSFGLRSQFTEEGLLLSVGPGVDTRWIGVLTREAFAVPLRIDLVVRPITELRFRFGSHRSLLAFDEHGALVNPAPWFMTVDEEAGRPHGADARVIPPDEWTRITLETRERERRLFVNGELRRSWHSDFSSIRSRIGIGLRKSALTVQWLTVEPL
jgi:hypothetical protein